MNDAAKVAAVARVLTKTQRYATIHMGGPYPDPPPQLIQRELRELDGLLWTSPPREPLPLGLLVRDFLRNQEGNGDG